LWDCADNYRNGFKDAFLMAWTVWWALTMRRGVTDPVCGMKVDKEKAIRMDVGGRTFYFCSDHCAATVRREGLPHGVAMT
jgi:YHS domain-containing protein